MANISYIDLDNGEKINNLIYGNQLNYVINKQNNKYELDWIIHNTSLNINELVYQNVCESYLIITKDDLNSLIGLLYSDNKQLLNYNDMYYIVAIEGFISFKSNDHVNKKIKKNFDKTLEIHQ